MGIQRWLLAMVSVSGEELFDEREDHVAKCLQCGKWVPTLAGWPGPIAACFKCDVWTNYNENPPSVVTPIVGSIMVIPA